MQHCVCQKIQVIVKCSFGLYFKRLIKVLMFYVINTWVLNHKSRESLKDDRISEKNS